MPPIDVAAADHLLTTTKQVPAPRRPAHEITYANRWKAHPLDG